MGKDDEMDKKEVGTVCSGRNIGCLAGAVAGYQLGRTTGIGTSFNLLRNWNSPAGDVIQFALAVGGSIVGGFAGNAFGTCIDKMCNKLASLNEVDENIDVVQEVEQ